jgi:hypothetical protein
MATAAAQLAGSFDLDLIVSAIASALAGSTLSAIQESLANAQNRAADVLPRFYLPQLPTRQDIVGRAMAMFAETPSMDAIAGRAQTAILEAIGARLSAIALQTAPAGFQPPSGLVHSDDSQIMPQDFARSSTTPTARPSALL